MTKRELKHTRKDIRVSADGKRVEHLVNGKWVDSQDLFKAMRGERLPEGE